MDIEITEQQKLCEAGTIKWTVHVVARLQKRGIEPSDIQSCIATGRIIEQYPDDYPYPSCLVPGATVNGSVLHTVVGVPCTATGSLRAKRNAPPVRQVRIGKRNRKTGSRSTRNTLKPTTG